MFRFVTCSYSNFAQQHSASPTMVLYYENNPGDTSDWSSGTCMGLSECNNATWSGNCSIIEIIEQLLVLNINNNRWFVQLSLICMSSMRIYNLGVHFVSCHKDSDDPFQLTVMGQFSKSRSEPPSHSPPGYKQLNFKVTRKFLFDSKCFLDKACETVHERDSRIGWLIHISYLLIYTMSCFHSATQPAFNSLPSPSCKARTLRLDVTGKLFNPFFFFFIPSLFIL